MIDPDIAVNNIRAMGTPICAACEPYAMLGYLAGVRAERERCARIADSYPHRGAVIIAEKIRTGE